MNFEDLRTLKILEELEGPHAPSQRDVARSLDISLGLVNAFVKRLVQKGYFKVTTIPRNRVKYILTPKGMAEKTRLTCEYIQYSIQFYKRARERFSALFSELAAQGVKSVAFYGANELSEIASVSLVESKLSLVAVADPEKAGKHFLGLVVADPAFLLSTRFDRIIVTDPGAGAQASATLEAVGVPVEKILVVDPV
ncbi:MAG: winged helix-turn-helix transcriptional regulator [Deltaproteobacteria bacterium]|nr:winged helix-turn-helix transcriptional regulator [Deltaproteobacteria bacterium]